MCSNNYFGRNAESIISRGSGARSTENENDTTATRHHIIETIIRIDRLQKEAVANLNSCLTCERSLNIQSYNTIPIILNLRGGSRLTGLLGTTGSETFFFRIESIIGNFITLRLLELSGSSLITTTFTLILDLDCVCSLQCLEAINLESCCTL